MVILDSNHTHEHVLYFNAYSSLVSKDSYCIVFDTIIEDMPEDIFQTGYGLKVIIQKQP